MITKQVRENKANYIISSVGDIIGIEGRNGNKTYFPAGNADNALTASTTQTQAGALGLNYRISRVTTVASAADAVRLPKALKGMSMTVINAAAANAMGVFPATGESINALAADAVLSVAANKAILFTCAVNGIWQSNLTA